MNRKVLASLALLACAPCAHAGGQYIGLVKPVHYGILYLDASQTQMSGRPSCATRTYVHLQEAPTDPAYKEKFSMLLGAWLADRPVALYGTGNCTSEGDEIIYVVTFP